VSLNKAGRKMPPGAIVVCTFNARSREAIILPRDTTAVCVEHRLAERDVGYFGRDAQPGLSASSGIGYSWRNIERRAGPRSMAYCGGAVTLPDRTSLPALPPSA
jgi:hypothetical protein